MVRKKQSAVKRPPSPSDIRRISRRGQTSSRCVDGQWNKFVDGRTADAGWSLISPDGKTLRSYGEPKTIDMTFSADSRRLYGIRVETDGARCIRSISPAKKRTIGEIGKDFTPASYSNPGIRLSLSPDGILYPATRRTSSLWMMEGFDRPGWVDQDREMMAC